MAKKKPIISISEKIMSNLSRAKRAADALFANYRKNKRGEEEEKYPHGTYKGKRVRLAF